jgi:hypothetical protein
VIPCFGYCAGTFTVVALDADLRDALCGTLVIVLADGGIGYPGVAWLDEKRG